MDIRHYFRMPEPPATVTPTVTPTETAAGPDPVRRTLDQIIADYERVHLAEQIRLERW